MRKVYKHTDINILRSSNNINLDQVLGYKKDSEYKSFLDYYDE